MDLHTDVEPVDYDTGVAKLNAIRMELRRRSWVNDPAAWAKDRMKDTLWSKQQEIIRSVANNRRTSVQSCHEIGKSFIAAEIAGWWLDVHAPGQAFVVTSAPTASQVRAILWREIGRVHTRGELRGRVNQTSWYMPVAGGKEELVAFGRKPAEYDPTSFQGIHARWVLVIFDEACGIPYSLWEAADSLIANDESKIVCFGNPDDPTTHFHEISKPGSGWNVIRVSAFDTPNFTGEPLPIEIRRNLIGPTYVEEKRKKWAPNWVWIDKDQKVVEPKDGIECVPPEGAKIEDTNPLWQSKVMGLFPVNQTQGGLIPISWIRAAQERTLKPEGPNELGVDVGGGGDTTCVCQRIGSVYRIIREDTDPDTMAQCGKVINDLRTSGARIAKVDKIGIGWGMVNRGVELGQPFVGINVGAGATDPESDPNNAVGSDDERFLNFKAECWWRVREMFEQGVIDIDPEDEDLAADLVNVRYRRNSNGKIQILDKRQNDKGESVGSPNRGESLMLAACVPKDNGGPMQVVRLGGT